MAVPFGGANFGRLTRGEEHVVEFPIHNDGPSELRTVLHANVGWLHVPGGQLRVPCGSTVHVPLRLNAIKLSTGHHTASIELDGNGGIVTVPIEVRVVHWFYNGATALLVICVGFAALLGVLAHLLLVFLHP
jgi:hypothetical protein